VFICHHSTFFFLSHFEYFFGWLTFCTHLNDGLARKSSGSLYGAVAFRYVKLCVRSVFEKKIRRLSKERTLFSMYSNTALTIDVKLCFADVFCSLYDVCILAEMSQSCMFVHLSIDCIFARGFFVGHVCKRREIGEIRWHFAASRQCFSSYTCWRCSLWYRLIMCRFG